MGISTGTELKHKPHAVASVKFTKGMPVDYCPITCTCGWKNLVGAWPLHAPRLSVSYAQREADPALPWMPIPGTRVMGVAL